MTRALALGVFALSLALTGCGTVENFTRPVEGGRRPLEVYGGTTRSVDTLKAAATNGDLVEASYAPLHASNVALSVVADTVTLPVTVATQAYRVASGWCAAGYWLLFVGDQDPQPVTNQWREFWFNDQAGQKPAEGTP